MRWDCVLDELEFIVNAEEPVVALERRRADTQVEQFEG